MFGLFKPPPPVGSDEFEWLIACFAWLMRTLDEGDPASLARTGVLTHEAVFGGVDPALEGHAFADALFDRVKRLCGAADWPCHLVAGETRRAVSLQPGFAIQHERQPPAGLFRIDEEAVTIAYDRALLATPHRLVATLAHELAHYLLAGKGDPPGGPDLLEHATDCAAIYLGFGAFVTNAAFDFQQFSGIDEAGWETQATGYLSEPARVTATALSAHSAGEDGRAAVTLLKPHLHRSFRRALGAVRRALPRGAPDLVNVDLADWA